MSNLNGIRERLREHPECIEIELFGETRPFLLTMYGLEKARQHGVEVVPLILDLGNRLAGLFQDEQAEDIEIGSPEMAERLKGMIKDQDARTLSVIVWWGLVTFDDDLSLEEVQMMLTPGTLLDLVPKVVERVNEFAEDTLDEDESATGKGPMGTETKSDNGAAPTPDGPSPAPESSESSTGPDTNRGSIDG